MTTHYHLVVEIPDGGLSEGMQLLNGEFSRRQSARYGRTAHLFQNRFGCRPLRTSEDAIGTIRYVLRNPVQAGLCRTPAGWPWSSYRATVGDVAVPPWLDVKRVHDLFRPFNPRDPTRGFKRVVDSGQDLVSDTKARPKRPSL